MKLQDKEFAKRYLHLVVDKAVVSEKTVTIYGSKANLAAAIHSYKKKGTSKEVPRFMRDWRANANSACLFCSAKEFVASDGSAGGKGFGTNALTDSPMVVEMAWMPVMRPILKAPLICFVVIKA